MRKEITIYVYDNSEFGKVLGELALNETGGDCCEMTVLLPDGWDWFENDFGKVIESPSGIRGPVSDFIKHKHGKPYLNGTPLKILSERRRSIAMTL